MLTQTICNDELSFDLACDDCGTVYPIVGGIRADAGDLWMSAYWAGWRLARGPAGVFGHRCARCVTGGPR